MSITHICVCIHMYDYICVYIRMYDYICVYIYVCVCVSFVIFKMLFSYGG
jgi:hypothetical protein